MTVCVQYNSINEAPVDMCLRRRECKLQETDGGPEKGCTDGDKVAEKNFVFNGVPH